MRSKKGLATRELAVFAMLGALMFVGDMLTEWIPNVHPVTMLVMVYTLYYREKGIVPIVVYIALQAVFFGGLWLVPYCYIFPLYWLVTLILPRKMGKVRAQIVYSVVCALFGLLFGTLYAPWSAVMFMKNASFSKIIAWIASGLPYDAIHAVGNFALSFLILPLVKLLGRIDNMKK